MLLILEHMGRNCAFKKYDMKLIALIQSNTPCPSRVHFEPLFFLINGSRCHCRTTKGWGLVDIVALSALNLSLAAEGAYQNRHQSLYNRNGHPTLDLRPSPHLPRLLSHNSARET